MTALRQNLSRQERDRAFRTMRQYTLTFTSAFAELARECNQTKGMGTLVVRHGETAGVTRVKSAVSSNLDHIVLSLNDPTKVIPLDMLDMNDPLFICFNAIGVHEVGHLCFGSYDLYESRGPALVGSLPPHAKAYGLMALNVVLDYLDDNSICQELVPEPGALMHSILITNILSNVILPKAAEETAANGVVSPNTFLKLILVWLYTRGGATTHIQRRVGSISPRGHTLMQNNLSAPLMVAYSHPELEQHIENTLVRLSPDMPPSQLRLRGIIGDNATGIVGLWQDMKQDIKNAPTLEASSHRTAECKDRIVRVAYELALYVGDLYKNDSSSKSKSKSNSKDEGQPDSDSDSPNDTDDTNDDTNDDDKGTDSKDDTKSKPKSKSKGKGDKPDKGKPDKPDKQDNKGDGTNKQDKKPKGDKQEKLTDERNDVMLGARKQMLEAMTKDMNVVGGGTGDNQQQQFNSWVQRNKSEYHLHKRAMRRLASTLLRSKVMVHCKPSPRGSWVRDVHRAYTDGRVFIRRDIQEGSNAAVAFVIDCSGSTVRFAAKMTAFCGCLAEGIRESGSSCAAWLFGSSYVPVPIRLLSRVDPPDLGGTMLSGSFRTAVDWLTDHNEDDYKRKVCVILTDGEAEDGDISAIASIAEDARLNGVELLVGCVTQSGGFDLNNDDGQHDNPYAREEVDLSDFIQRTMPYANAFKVHTNFSISAHMLARLIANNRRA